MKNTLIRYNSASSPLKLQSVLTVLTPTTTNKDLSLIMGSALVASPDTIQGKFHNQSQNSPVQSNDKEN